MPSWLKAIGQFFRSMQGWLWAAFTVIPAGWTLVSGILESLPMSQAVPLTTGALAFGAALAYYGMRGFDYARSYFGERRQLLEAAERLRGMREAGHIDMTIGQLAGIWAGDDAGKLWVFNPILRKLKKAVNDRRISRSDKQTQLPLMIGRDTQIPLDDVIALLEKREI